MARMRGTSWDVYWKTPETFCWIDNKQTQNQDTRALKLCWLQGPGPGPQAAVLQRMSTDAGFAVTSGQATALVLRAGHVAP
jgi:hypothetical protein